MKNTKRKADVVDLMALLSDQHKTEFSDLKRNAKDFKKFCDYLARKFELWTDHSAVDYRDMAIALKTAIFVFDGINKDTENETKEPKVIV